MVTQRPHARGKKKIKRVSQVGTRWSGLLGFKDAKRTG